MTWWERVKLGVGVAVGALIIVAILIVPVLLYRLNAVVMSNQAVALDTQKLAQAILVLEKQVSHDHADTTAQIALLEAQVQYLVQLQLAVCANTHTSCPPPPNGPTR